MRSIFNNFLRGLLFVFPIAATLYIIYASIIWSNNFFNNLLFQWLNIDIPGLGIVTVFLGIALMGYIFSRTLTRPIITYFEELIKRVPIVKIIYTSLKELTEAFIGDKKRFNEPVICDLGTSEVKRIGFITQKDLSHLNLEKMVAVYCPDSYNVTGKLYILPADKVQLLPANSTDVMKYVVSGGITNIKKQKI